MIKLDPKIQNLLFGLVIGILATLLVSNYSVNSRNYGMMQMMGMRRGAEHMMGGGSTSENEMMSMMHGDDEMSMKDMVDNLEGLFGDEFDRAFVQLMIEHHEGAIDMAELISSKSERQEVRKMGEDIINVQSAEIQMMKGWLNDWSNN